MISSPFSILDIMGVTGSKLSTSLSMTFVSEIFMPLMLTDMSNLIAWGSNFGILGIG
jgi:hypothetical protein